MHVDDIPYSRKFWRGIKFGGLAVCVNTAKLKSAKFCYVCMYVWRYRTIPPNLIPIMVLKTSFWAKPPNLMTANISGYTVISLSLQIQGYHVIFAPAQVYCTVVPWPLDVCTPLKIKKDTSIIRTLSSWGYIE